MGRRLGRPGGRGVALTSRCSHETGHRFLVNEVAKGTETPGRQMSKALPSPAPHFATLLSIRSVGCSEYGCSSVDDDSWCALWLNCILAFISIELR